MSMKLKQWLGRGGAPCGRALDDVGHELLKRDRALLQDLQHVPRQGVPLSAPHLRGKSEGPDRAGPRTVRGRPRAV